MTANHMRTLAGLAVVLVGWVALVRNPNEAKDEPKKDQPPAAPRDVVAIINRGGYGNCHVIPGVPGADGEVGPMNPESSCDRFAELPGRLCEPNRVHRVHSQK